MINAKNLTYLFSSASEALTFPDIDCQAGEHWLLLGKSGSGKTTLLNLLAGLRTPTSGTVKIGDTLLNNLRPSQLDLFRGDHIGMIFQRSHFIRSLNVWQNLALAQSLAGKSADKNDIRRLLDRLNISHKFDAHVNDLSVGEQQRVAIARALINRPLVIMADEPTSALDDVNTEEVVSLLEEQASSVNATLLVVTHDNRLKQQFSNQIQL